MYRDESIILHNNGKILHHYDFHALLVSLEVPFEHIIKDQNPNGDTLTLLAKNKSRHESAYHTHMLSHRNYASQEALPNQAFNVTKYAISASKHTLSPIKHTSIMYFPHMFSLMFTQLHI